MASEGVTKEGTTDTIIVEYDDVLDDTICRRRFIMCDVVRNVKKIGVVFLCFLSIFIFGSCQKQENVKIEEWMFADDLDYVECNKLLGNGVELDGPNYKIFTWNNFELIHNYPGTLSVDFILGENNIVYENRNMYYWNWKYPCTEQEEEKVIKELDKHFGNHDSLPDGPYEYSFKTDFEDTTTIHAGADRYVCYTVNTSYEDGVLTVSWGDNRSIRPK